MHRAALMLLFAFLLTKGVAAEPVPEDDEMDLFAQEFLAEMRAKAYKGTRVFVHLGEEDSADANSIIGALVMPCNPLWADGCAIPTEPLVRMLRDAGSPAAATCDRAPVHILEDCLPGFGVLPSPNGEQLYLTPRRT